MFITCYHKSQSLFDTPKVIPHFLPGRVGQLVALYLVYVLPLRERLTEHVQRSQRSDYIWAGEHGPWETDKLTQVIITQSSAALNNRLTTLEYRHAAIEIGREFVDEGFGTGTQDEVGEVEEAEVEADSPLEMSAGRTERIGVNRYGVPSDMVKHLSIRSLRTFRPLSEAWHRFLGMAGGGSKEVRSELKGASIESSGAKVGRKHIRGPSDALGTQLLLQKKRLAARAYSSEEVELFARGLSWNVCVCIEKEVRRKEMNGIQVAIASNSNLCSDIDEMKGARSTGRRKSKDAYRRRGAQVVKTKPQPLFPKHSLPQSPPNGLATPSTGDSRSRRPAVENGWDRPA